jgi:hypothetical protein
VVLYRLGMKEMVKQKVLYFIKRGLDQDFIFISDKNAQLQDIGKRRLENFRIVPCLTFSGV